MKWVWIEKGIATLITIRIIMLNRLDRTVSLLSLYSLWSWIDYFSLLIQSLSNNKHCSSLEGSITGIQSIDTKWPNQSMSYLAIYLYSLIKMNNKRKHQNGYIFYYILKIYMMSCLRCCQPMVICSSWKITSTIQPKLYLTNSH